MDFLEGATGMGYLVAGWFFWRYYARTKDRFFRLFSIAFFMFAINRAFLTWLPAQHEATLVVYLSRLLGFAMIALAVIEKNQRTT